eukprot:6532992-Prymnesium_polylepis.1
MPTPPPPPPPSPSLRAALHVPRPAAPTLPGDAACGDENAGVPPSVNNVWPHTEVPRPCPPWLGSAGLGVVGAGGPRRPKPTAHGGIAKRRTVRRGNRAMAGARAMGGAAYASQVGLGAAQAAGAENVLK